ncbi:MAG: 6-pyruvoyl tetrahydropterin synthase family protein [Pirellulales bacterium]|nr:6-pyruvoyl tetrahydropterin synthase family protein [Pirellulales bacterium]
METFGVRVAQDDLVFSAAHFITLDARQCERLHGHNYRVAVTVQAPLDDSQCVLDFHALHRLTRELIEPLDHRILLPTEHPTIQISESDTQVEVSWTARRWVFPRAECILLAMSNTTAESLAQWLGHQLVDALEKTLGFVPQAVRVELEETTGHSAFFDWRAD